MYTAIQTAEDAESDDAGCGDIALEDDADDLPLVLDPIRQAWRKRFRMEHARSTDAGKDRNMGVVSAPSVPFPPTQPNPLPSPYHIFNHNTTHE